MPSVRAWIILAVVAIACNGKSAPAGGGDVRPNVVDPCPLDDVFEDDWPGCPGETFSGDERILGGTNPFPCEVARFGSTGFQLGTAKYELDTGGHLSRMHDSYSGGSSSTITIQYDSAGRRTSAHYEGREGSVHWTYERDGQGRLTKTTMIPQSGSLGTEVTTYRRDDAGRTLTIDHAVDNGETTHQTLVWRDGQLITSTRDTKETDGRSSRTITTVTRDAHGRRVELKRTNDGSVTVVNFRYDPQGRLVEIRDNNASTAISYDAEGRVSEVSNQDGIRRYSYCQR